MRDLCYILGAGLIGYGLWLWFAPLVYVYTGCVLVGAMVLTGREPRGIE